MNTTKVNLRKKKLCIKRSSGAKTKSFKRNSRKKKPFIKRSSDALKKGNKSYELKTRGF